MSSEQWYQCYPEVGNRSCIRQSPSQSYYIYVAVLYTFSICSGILNLMVIISISHFRQLHSSVNFLLLNLAVSDFLVCCVVVPVDGLYQYTCWKVGDIMCVLYSVFVTTVICSSIGDMVLISIDRYVAICDPMHYSTRMCRFVSIALISCWILTILGSIGSYYNDIINIGRYRRCEGECVILGTYLGLYFDLVVNFCGSFVIIIILYLRVFFVAVSQARAMCSQVAAPTQQSAVNSRKSELKAARSLGFVVLLFLLCYTPAYVANLIFEYINSYVYTLLHIMIYLNSCFNPILYALQYPWFRRSVKIIVTFRIFQSGSRDTNVLMYNVKQHFTI